MRQKCHAAIDLGAGSGRVFVGTIGDDGARLQEAHRFTYRPRQTAGHLRWDMASLLAGVFAGLASARTAAAAASATLESIGVDSWGVDYGLLDERGELIEDPICYRDERTAGVMERAAAVVPRDVLFRATGIQLLPINTVFQLMAHVERGLPSGAERLLMIPDLCHHALCGSTSSEHTNASTTALLNIDTGDWDDSVLSALGLPRTLMPPLRSAGAVLRPLREDVRRELDMPAIRIIQPATHDTASAVAGTPLHAGWAFISSGTWSLVGVERRSPLRDAPVLAANFTNERGVDGTFRFLKNVMGLWILESCRREWLGAGLAADLTGLLAAAARMREPTGLIYPDDPRFFNPPSMTAAVRTALRETGQSAPEDQVTLTRVVLDSLALRYSTVVDTIERLTGERVEGIHIVGGGSLNDYLNQATANAAERPVLAGPTEATAFGNLLVQSIASGATTMEEGRRLIGEFASPRRFEPADGRAWAAARQRYHEVEDQAIRRVTQDPASSV